jgi:hypothetical protein
VLDDVPETSFEEEDDDDPMNEDDGNNDKDSLKGTIKNQVSIPVEPVTTTTPTFVPATHSASETMSPES